MSMLPAGAIAQRGELAPDLVGQGCKGRRQQHGCWGGGTMVASPPSACAAVCSKATPLRCRRHLQGLRHGTSSQDANGHGASVVAQVVLPVPRGLSLESGQQTPGSPGETSAGAHVWHHVEVVCCRLAVQPRGACPGVSMGRRPQHLYTAPFAKRKPCMARAWHANVLGQTTVAWALLAGTARLSDGRCDFVARISPRVWWLPQQKQLTGLRRL